MSDLGQDLGPDIGPDILPRPVAAGTSGTQSSAILVTVVFTFPFSAPAALPGEGQNPDLGPDIGPDINPDISEPPIVAQSGNVQNSNAGQSVSVQMLDGAGNALQDYQPGLTVDFGNGQYGATFSVPPGFAGFARAELTSGPNAGQTDTHPVSLGAAQDLSDVAWTLGPPQTSVFDASSNALVAGSDGFLHVLVNGTSNETGLPVNPAGNPVAVAVTAGTPGPDDFQTADWLPVTLPGASAPSTFARLALSADKGNTLAAGNYRVTLQINGTMQMRVPSYVSVGN